MIFNFFPRTIDVRKTPAVRSTVRSVSTRAAIGPGQFVLCVCVYMCIRSSTVPTCKLISLSRKVKLYLRSPIVASRRRGLKRRAAHAHTRMAGRCGARWSELELHPIRYGCICCPPGIRVFRVCECACTHANEARLEFTRARTDEGAVVLPDISNDSTALRRTVMQVTGRNRTRKI